MLSSISTIASNLPPILPGIGGAVLTGLQVMVASISFSLETNPETTSQYSKFAPRHDDKESSQTMIGSRDGMTRIYLPAFVVSSALYILPEVTDISFLPQQTLAGQFVIVLFLKRLLEVYYLHKYSGKVSQHLSTGIGIYYALVSTLICSVAYPATNGVVANVGTALFAIGMAGNVYHHYLLANLRGDSKKTDGEKKYVAPKGGLFNYVAAPHYFFEMLGWLGIAAVAQQMNAYLVFASMASYLSGRAYSQNEWNRSEFSEADWPASRKNVVPFIF